ncbi:MAG: exodeoxyribonuclease VII small subunit [Clostridia bacterium]|nr:exodeoxyribonuclease VII small subunit [Oscillospiraceae bacterium]MBQ8324424.1 exodeoxyribonuclease VII small subunit [Clostridia bacterium]MBQ8912113.1 exodeoxyribonuclease VII small subunit [Clostridia bacterium]MBQ9793878.1 exodeoxyribonuclease VII small subunit [Clostridia bacterium]MBR4054970.1 exodeoxyribonuclease VII small subunit [Clostridia bacterium]
MEEMTFEQALARLEQIVKELEGGNVPLDDLMRLYDEGTTLVKACTEKITAAEQKVRLVQMKNGAVTEEAFEGQ